MTKIRTFIAVNLSDSVRSRITEVENLLMAADADVKWVGEKNLHITLKFIGSVEEDRVDSIIQSVRIAVEGIHPFPVDISGVGAFPHPSRPHVIWVGITTGKEEFSALAQQIEKSMEEAGFAREPKGFNPHITVGRVKTQKGVARLREMIEELRDQRIDSFKVERIAIMKSELFSTGSIYTRLEEIELKRQDYH